MGKLLNLTEQKAVLLCRTTSEMLGSQPATDELLDKYIRSKLQKELEKLRKELQQAKSQEEKLVLEEKLAALEEEVGEERLLPDAEDKMTVFPRTDKGELCILNYQIVGMLKETLHNFGSERGLKNAVSKYVFVDPRHIVLYEDDEMTKPLKYADRILDRPLRAYTPAGFIVSIARSEVVEEPAYFAFTLRVLKTAKTPFTLEDLIEVVKIGGREVGLMQWRTAGYGRFEVLEVKEIS